MKKLIQDFKTPVSPFFQRIRNTGLLLTGLATALLTAPVVLPVMVTTIAGYIAVAGTVAATVSQFTTDTAVAQDKT